MNLEDFLGRLMPAEIAVLSHDAVVVGTELAALESLLGGITTALDMYYLPDAALEVAARSGMRIHCGPNLLESDGPEPLPFAQRIKWANEWLTDSVKREQEFSLPNGFDSLNWLSPHSTYLLGEDHLNQIAALAKQHGAHIHVHAAETVGEMSLVSKRHNGRTPIKVLADTQLLANAVLAHGVHLDDTDIAMISQHGATVTHCPASNYKLASGTARIVDLHKQGVNVALGTDGPASGNDLDLWLAMRLAGYVQKTAASDPTVLPALDVLRMATINGAKALHIMPTSSCSTLFRHLSLRCLTRMSPLSLPLVVATFAMWLCMAKLLCAIAWHSPSMPVLLLNEPTNSLQQFWRLSPATSVGVWPHLHNRLIGKHCALLPARHSNIHMLHTPSFE
jgi:5-methylthioadenosine/S-adenosylhomocysteine deaminase